MFEDLQFELRRRWLGRLVLRTGLPRVQGTADAGECAYYRKLLCAAASKKVRREVGRVVDVGCRNWSYAQALADCFPNAALLGVELDGYRRYWNMFRRIDYAQAHAAELPRPARALAADFRDVADLDTAAARGHTLFCFIFPFVSANPCLRWGLPRRHADYHALLRHALGLVPPGDARFLAVHQGDWEVEEARRVYAELAFDMQEVKLTPRDWAGLWPSFHDNWVCWGGPSLLIEPLAH